MHADIDAAQVDELARRMAQILHTFDHQAVVRRLRVRLHDLRHQSKDEPLEFRQLQKALREDEELLSAFESAGLTGLLAVDTRAGGPEAGPLINAFNLCVENYLGP